MGNTEYTKPTQVSDMTAYEQNAYRRNMNNASQWILIWH